MPEAEAVRFARRAAARAHLAKNAFHDDAGLTKLADAIENLALAVAELAQTHPLSAPLSAPGPVPVPVPVPVSSDAV
jgi:hypothetical protein